MDLKHAAPDRGLIAMFGAKGNRGQELLVPNAGEAGVAEPSMEGCSVQGTAPGLAKRPLAEWPMMPSFQWFPPTPLEPVKRCCRVTLVRPPRRAGIGLERRARVCYGGPLSPAGGALSIRYPIAAPCLRGNEAKYVAECLESTWNSSSGSFLARFEREFADYVGAAHAIPTSNGTVALHLALLGLGIGPGDEVIVPALTYVASANSVVYCGAEPVFADVDPRTWCVDPASVERLVGPRTRAVMPVHLFGNPCDMPALVALAERHGVALVEDCAETLGARNGAAHTGTLGAVGTFSFFGNKTITTGEGGMVVTSDTLLAERMRLLRGQGMDPARRYWHTVVGYNYRMTNVAAAIGAAQLERVAELVADRRRIAGWYDAALRRHAEVVRPVELPDCTNSYWMYSVLLPDARRREAVMAAMAADGVETRPMFYPCMDFPMYRQARTDGGCPVAVEVGHRGISLPSSSYLEEGDVAYIAERLLRAVQGQPALRKAA